MFTANYSDFSNLVPGNKCIVHENTYGTYWWGQITSCKDKDSYLLLEVETNHGPFKIQNGEKIFSNEKPSGSILSGRIYPITDSICDLIQSLINRNDDYNKSVNQTRLYEGLYHDVLKQALKLVKDDRI